MSDLWATLWDFYDDVEKKARAALAALQDDEFRLPKIDLSKLPRRPPSPYINWSGHWNSYTGDPYNPPQDPNRP